MASKFGTWRQKIQHHPFIAIGILVLLIAFLAFALAVHWWGWDWTGFNRYIGPELRPNQQYRPEKTLWDWLQLLIVPLVLAVGVFWLSQMQKKAEQRSTRDNQCETALQAYIDKMSELLLKEHLGELTANSELKPENKQVRNVARVRTITILTQLDAGRISYVFAFLREAGLMSTTPNDNVVSLKYADLHAVNWSQADLSAADLSDANLSRADLSRANLSLANLSGANLSSVNLSRADLSFANLSSVNLSRADLSFANLYDVNLSRVNLSAANLSAANLSRAYLSGTSLSAADLSRADLNGASLSRTDLNGANLSAASLRDVIGITIEELEKQAKSLKDATMPNGSKHP